MINKTIDSHIEDDENQISNPDISSQRRRHLKFELEQLKRYKESYPDSTRDPSSLELFCNDNPEALECRIYE